MAEYMMLLKESLHSLFAGTLPLIPEEGKQEGGTPGQQDNRDLELIFRLEKFEALCDEMYAYLVLFLLEDVSSLGTSQKFAEITDGSITASERRSFPAARVQPLVIGRFQKGAFGLFMNLLP